MRCKGVNSFATKRTGGRHARDGGLFAVGTGNFPAEAGPNQHLLASTAGDD